MVLTFIFLMLTRLPLQGTTCAQAIFSVASRSRPQARPQTSPRSAHVLARQLWEARRVMEGQVPGFVAILSGPQ